MCSSDLWALESLLGPNIDTANVNTTGINSNDIDYNSILNQQSSSSNTVSEVELSQTGEFSVISKKTDSYGNSPFHTEKDINDQNDPIFSSSSSSTSSQFDSLKPPKPPGFFSGNSFSSLKYEFLDVEKEFVILIEHIYFVFQHIFSLRIDLKYFLIFFFHFIFFSFPFLRVVRAY